MASGTPREAMLFVAMNIRTPSANPTPKRTSTRLRTVIASFMGHLRHQGLLSYRHSSHQIELPTKRAWAPKCSATDHFRRTHSTKGHRHIVCGIHPNLHNSCRVLYTTRDRSPA